MTFVMTRNRGQRMWGSRGKGTTVVGGGGDAGVTGEWVNERYVSIDFFNRMFYIEGRIQTWTRSEETDWTLVSEVSGVAFYPNRDLTTVEEYNETTGVYTKTVYVVDRTRISGGIWSESFVSSLGLNDAGGSGGGSTTLAGLTDVSLSSLSNGQALIYRNGVWRNETIQSGGGGTVTSVGMTVPSGFAVTPVSITSSGTFTIAFGGTLTKNQVLATPATANGTPGWRALVASDIPDLSSTYLTSSALNGYATQQWVSQNYLGINATAAKATQLATARTLWGQSFDGTENITGSLSNVGNVITSEHGENYLEGFRTIELYGKGGQNPSNYGGYIDFHYNDDSNDYTSRIIEDAYGRLYLDAPNGVRIGNALLRWDSTYNALRIDRLSSGSIMAGNLYATGYISALGMNGGSSSIDDMTFGNVHAQRFYVGTNRYIYLDGTTLKFYDNGTIKTIAFS